MRRIAAERADCWNTFALGAVPLDEIADSVRAQNRDLDEQCLEVGRNPATLRRSLACWKPLDPWETPDAFERIVAWLRDAGISEFNVMPPDERLPLLEKAAATIADLRAG